MTFQWNHNYTRIERSKLVKLLVVANQNALFQ